jgi:hypothetical protein
MKWWRRRRVVDTMDRVPGLEKKLTTKPRRRRPMMMKMMPTRKDIKYTFSA